MTKKQKTLYQGLFLNKNNFGKFLENSATIKDLSLIEKEAW